jgi:hypothetical protein
MWQGDSSSSSFRVIVGQPVANCEGTSSTKTTFTGTVEVGHTFGTETSGGLELGAGGPKIETKIITQTSSKIVKSQSVEITVEPGKIVCDSIDSCFCRLLTCIQIQGALVANVSYTKTPGDMQIDDR